MKEKKIKQEKVRKVFLEGLPRGGKYLKETDINWKESKGYIVHFIYEDIDGYVEIIDCKKKNLYIKYLNYDVFKIDRDVFKKCGLGGLLGKITSDFKIKNNAHFRDEKRDITIVDMEIRPKEKIDRQGRKSILNEKWYKYTCGTCGYKGWMIEGSLLSGNGCLTCTNHILVQGINDIPTTNPEMVKYFQGGYEEAKLYTIGGGGNPNNKNGYIYPICPDCGRIRNKKILISNIFKTHSIGCSCGDGMSYPEKFTFKALEQLGLDFEYHKTFDWSKNVKVNNPKLCGNKEYDFYIPDLNILIETNGNQHYEDTKIGRGKGRSFKEEVENDEIKKELSLNNSIKEENYIVIDCRQSNLEYIKQNILKSKLNDLFNLSNINWVECGEFACANLVKEVCDLWNNGEHSTVILAKIMKISYNSILRFLKKGMEIHWCHYNSEEEMKKNGSRNGKSSGKPTEIFKDGVSLGIFVSATELGKRSEELFGVKLLNGCISDVCNGKYRTYKGFTFKYV